MAQLEKINVSVSKSFLYRTFCPTCRTNGSYIYSQAFDKQVTIPELRLSTSIANSLDNLYGMQEVATELLSLYRVLPLSLVAYSLGFNNLSKTPLKVNEVYIYCGCGKSCWKANFVGNSKLNKHRKSSHTKQIKRGR